MTTRAIHLPLALIAGCISILPLVSQGAVVGYWRFEGADDATGFLADSSGNGKTLTETGDPAPVASPFTNPVPQTGTTNLQAAGLEAIGTDRFTRADDADFAFQDFTIEAYINLDTAAAGSSRRVIASQEGLSGNFGWSFIITGAGSGLGARNLALQISSDGTSPGTPGAQNIDSDLVIALDISYYVAVAVDISDTSTSGITFYLRDLTNAGPLITVGRSHVPTNLFDTTANFFIGGNVPGSPFDGMIDEVRLSNTELSAAELLVVPEPGSAAMLLAGAGLLFARRRRA